MILPTKEFIEDFKKIRGAFSVTEAIALFNIVLQAPIGLYCELGVAHGKSAFVMAGAMNKGNIILVEPEFEKEEWLKDTISSIVKAVQYKLHIFPIAGYSTDVLDGLPELAYCMVDSGSHQDGLPLAEVKLLEDKMIKGGIIAFHDFCSQFVEIEQAYHYLLSTGKYEEIKVDWQEIINHVKENNYEAGNDSWHHTEMEFPNFLGAVRRK